MKVEIRNLNKSYGSLKAVNNISFETESPNIFGLIGPNGAGKSTIIRMIMNILLPDKGEILFNEKPITEKDKDRIGYLPEERGLYKKVKVNDLLKYFAALKGEKNIQKNIDYWLDKFGLLKKKNKKIEELSKGMTQKIQFIVAVLHDPDIIFLDEPFSGLDPISTEILREAILELSKNNKTILFSTHIMEEAEKLCSNIFLINKGKEVLYGNLHDIKSSFGKNTVIIEFDGNLDIIKNSKVVSNIISYPRWIEAEIVDGKKPDNLLQEIVGKISIKRFELLNPSLNKIFLTKIKDLQIK